MDHMTQQVQCFPACTTGGVSNLLNGSGRLASGASVSFSQIVDAGSISVTGILIGNSLMFYISPMQQHSESTSKL